MTDSPLEALLRRDRYAVLAALLLLTAFAWTYVLWLSKHMAMPASSMPGMDLRMTMNMKMDMGAMAPQVRPWVATDLLFGFTMWAIMMGGMMLPSVAPMILLYARVGR